MKKVTIIMIMLLATAFSSCAVAFRVAEGVASVPAAIIHPLAIVVERPCPSATNAWEGTAGSLCRQHIPESKAGWGPSIPKTCKTDLSPAATFAAHCSRCHDTGKAPDLAVSTTVAWSTVGELASLLHDGRPEQGMPSFAGRLTSCQIDALTTYIKGR